MATQPTDDFDAFDDFDDAAADRWIAGALAGDRNQPKASTDPDYLEGYAEGQDRRRVRVVMPVRPEGYYHVDPRGEDY